MIAVSDSVATHGLPDGRYTVAGQDYIVQNGVSRCANGTLDGGGVYLDGAVRNLQSIGIPAQDACLMASTTPAALLGLPRPPRRAGGMERRMAGGEGMAR